MGQALRSGFEPFVAWRPWAVAAVLGLAAVQAHAAGGHFAVDDAAILDPGACKLDGWYSRSPGDSHLLHAGGACRMGPVEVGAGADHERLPGTSQTDWGLGIKWARPLTDALSVGASLGPAWQARARPRYQGATVAALLTWTASERLQLHANFGRDLVRGDGDQPRAGVSAAWEFRKDWSAIVERFRADGGHFVRAGLRWEAAQGWTLDLSRSDHIAGSGTGSWTLGLSREFERP